jgi:hypothetical protein
VQAIKLGFDIQPEQPERPLIIGFVEPYDPTTDRITKLKSGIDWLDSSSWITNTHLAVKEPSKR